MKQGFLCEKCNAFFIDEESAKGCENSHIPVSQLTIRSCREYRQKSWGFIQMAHLVPQLIVIDYPNGEHGTYRLERIGPQPL